MILKRGIIDEKTGDQEELFELIHNLLVSPHTRLVSCSPLSLLGTLLICPFIVSPFSKPSVESSYRRSHSSSPRRGEIPSSVSRGIFICVPRPSLRWVAHWSDRCSLSSYQKRWPFRRSAWGVCLRCRWRRFTLCCHRLMSYLMSLLIGFVESSWRYDCSPIR